MSAAAAADPLARLNAAPGEEAEADLLACCGSRRWAERMAAARPFADLAAAVAAGDRIWGELAGEDWLEAFRAHPRIGETRSKGGSARATGWAASEQAGVHAAAADTLAALAAANRAYDERFGFLFLVCASGKSAAEMLALLRARMANDPATELRVAGAEQAKITRLRLERLLAS